MNKNEAYAEAKRLASQLGQPITAPWVGTTKYFWIGKIEQLRNIGGRKVINFHKAQRLANKHNIPIQLPGLAETTNEQWVNEITRIKTQARIQADRARQARPRKRNLWQRVNTMAQELDEPRTRWRGVTIEQLQNELVRLRNKQRRNQARDRAVRARRQLLDAPRVDRTRAVARLEERRQIRRQRQIETGAENTLRINGRMSEKLLRTGDRQLRFKHRVPHAIKLLITTANLPAIRRQLEMVLRVHQAEIRGDRFRISIKDTRRANDNHISNTYQNDTIQAVVNDLMTRHIGPYARGHDSDQAGLGFEISQISLFIFKVNRRVMGHSTRTIAQATKKWYIVSPKTKFNCLFQSIAVCKNFTHNLKLLAITEEGHKARVNSGKKLKYAVKPTKDNYADEKSVQEVCDYVRKPVELYNNVFEIIKTFKPKNPIKRIRGIKKYSIQKVGIHCNALVLKKDILKASPKFEFPKLGEVVELKQDESKNEMIIRKRKYFHSYNHKIASWDIETSLNMRGEHIPYACSIAWYDNKYGKPKIEKVWKFKTVKGKKEYYEKEIEVPTIESRQIKEKQFWDTDCLQKMTKWIFKNKKIFNGYTLYAHNGGKYDLPLVIKKAFIDSPDFIIEGKGCVELNNAWIGFTLRAKHDRKYKLYFRDSYRLLPMGLAKICKELEVPHQKLAETVNHNEITLINYNTFPQLKTYLTHDVFGLLEVLDVFGKGVFKDLGIDITKCFTGASLSKINFFKNYYDNKKFPIYKLCETNDKFVRDSYFGGRVEVGKLGEIGKNYYYDFTSLYPDVGRKYLPYGKPELLEFKNEVKLEEGEESKEECKYVYPAKLPKDFFGWVKCKVRTKDKRATPKHAMLNKSRLVFPIFDNWTEMNLFSEELDYDIYEYQFIKGVKFKKGKFKKKFFNDGFMKKAKSKAKGDFAMAQAYKIIINSGYGFWGLRVKDRDGVMIFEPNDSGYRKYLDTNKLLSIREHNDYVFCRVMKDLEVTDFNVAVAAAISSYARSKLHSIISEVKKVGGVIYYCDTDSLITNINIKDYPHIQKQFQWDGDGTELGSLKNECDEKVEKLLKKMYPDNEAKREQIFNDMVQAENGNLSFDEGCITGCKQYALRKKLMIEGNEHILEIVKLKGYSQSKPKENVKSQSDESKQDGHERGGKLKYEDMQTVNNGFIFQQQTQFRCPKSNYVSDTRSFTIKSKKIKKNFRRVYTKGLVFKNWVSPLHF
jgi:hypothetical protein